MTSSKDILRKLVPDFVLKYRSLVLRRGPKAGKICAKLYLFDLLGIRGSNRRPVPASGRSFLFVCFGNIMRSAMAESLMKQGLIEAGLEDQVRLMSAGLHASAGREAHPLGTTGFCGLGHFAGRASGKTADCRNGSASRLHPGNGFPKQSRTTRGLSRIARQDIHAECVWRRFLAVP